jgi:hypothetical protein
MDRFSLNFVFQYFSTICREFARSVSARSVSARSVTVHGPLQCTVRYSARSVSARSVTVHGPLVHGPLVHGPLQSHKNSSTLREDRRTFMMISR